MDRLKLFAPLAVFLVLSIFMYQGLKKDPNDLPSALLNDPLPAFSMPSLNDENRLITHETFKGQPYLLNVWATWCPSCKVEHPFLLKLADLGIPIVGINYKDESQAARDLLKATGNPYVENIVDEEGRLGINLGVYGAPETFIVDAEGIIRYKLVGVVDEEVWSKEMAPIFFTY